MPHPGEQHVATANPFEEPQRRMSEYTAQEIATLQSRLEKQLGPEYISARSGPSGQKVHYIAAEKCIALANEVFGFNGWSSSIQNIQVDFVDENPQTLKISLGLSVIVRVTLRDGTFHEDIGYGHIENCKGKAAAFEKAKKEGTTDALKRALRNFGNVLGNCIYDKSYLAKVTKMKVEPTRFDESNLHRHSNFVKKEPTEGVKISSGGLQTDNDISQAQSAMDSFEDVFGEFDEVDFSVAEEGHPDEIVLSHHSGPNDREKALEQQANNATTMQPPSRPLARSASAGSALPRQPGAANQAFQRGPSNGGSYQPAQGHTGARPPQQPQQPQNQHQQQQQHHQHQHQQVQHQHQNRPSPQMSNTNGSINNAVQTPPPPGAGTTTTNAGVIDPATTAAGFFSARALSQLPEESLSTAGRPVAPQAGQAFNPHAESPSIRKTPGIDHTKSKPVAKNGQHVPPPPSTPSTPSAAATAAAVTRGAAVASGVQQQAQSLQATATAGRQQHNVVNPQLDHARRIGAPSGPGSPLANRGQYRPPTVINKRQYPGGESAGPAAVAGAGPAAGLPAGPPGQPRPPLADVSNNAAAGVAVHVGAAGPDAKRQKMA